MTTNYKIKFLVNNSLPFGENVWPKSANVNDIKSFLTQLDNWVVTTKYEFKTEFNIWTDEWARIRPSLLFESTWTCNSSSLKMCSQI